MRVWFDGMPGIIRAEIDAYSLSFVEQSSESAPIDAAHILVTNKTN